MRTKKARSGDVCEIQTPAGLAYVQLVHEHQQMGELVRVLPGLYPSRPNIPELSRQKELYFVFYTLQLAIKAGQTIIVTNAPVPEWAKSPLMRAHSGRDRSGRTLSWRIINPLAPFTREEVRPIKVVSTLTPEDAQLSIHMLWPHPVLVKELARGWTPARAEELRLKDVAEHEAEIARNPPKPAPESERVRHYLYFSDNANAEKAAQWFRSQGFSVEVRLGGDYENWLALVKHGPLKSTTDLEMIRDEMEALAKRLDGEYDGWEVAV